MLLCLPLFALLVMVNIDTTAEGHLSDGMQPFEAEIIDFLEQHEIRAASVAVADHGKVVLSRGYGVADIPSQRRVNESTLFRIASISKPITAVATLKLVQAGKLGLDDRVSDILGPEILGERSYTDPRFHQVTVRMLLEHRGGWDREKSFDPMFQSVRFAAKLSVAPPASATTVIKAMADQPLDFDPGTAYAYSNFGYNLLGRIIEQASGMAYEQFVKNEVLAPIGIRTMRIGATLLAARGADETTYDDTNTGPSVFHDTLGQTVSSTDGTWFLEAMDSHGGWLASAGDLVRFAIALGNADAGLLDEKHLQFMHRRPTTEPSSEVYYSLGWQNRIVSDGKMNHWHAGSLPGTASILIRRHDGKVFAAILNTRQSPKTTSLGSELDKLMHRAASKVTDWP